MITLKEITKSYEIKRGAVCHALQGVTYTFENGKSYAVTGASGSGKSTLLGIIAGIIRPTNGIYTFQEKNMIGLSDKKMNAIRNKWFGIVVQDFALLESETALKNCMMPALLAGVSGRKAKQKAAALLERVGLRDRMYQNVNLLSGGERQRTAIARALINDPALILADEPTGALDSKNGNLVIEELLSVCQSGATLILATHDAGFAKKCQCQIHLHDGKIEVRR